jgi:hypothetical protein
MVMGQREEDSLSLCGSVNSYTGMTSHWMFIQLLISL